MILYTLSADIEFFLSKEWSLGLIFDLMWWNSSLDITSFPHWNDVVSSIVTIYGKYMGRILFHSSEEITSGWFVSSPYVHGPFHFSSYAWSSSFEKFSTNGSSWSSAVEDWSVMIEKVVEFSSIKNKYNSYIWNRGGVIYILWKGSLWCWCESFFFIFFFLFSFFLFRFSIPVERWGVPLKTGLAGPDHIHIYIIYIDCVNRSLKTTTH